MTLDEAQVRVRNFTTRCFGEEQTISAKVRALRLLEEAIEFAQSANVEPSTAHELINYVYSRPSGTPFQELGGVAITWLAACNSLPVKAADVLRVELERVEAKSPEHFTQRNQLKNDLGFDGSTQPPRESGIGE